MDEACILSVMQFEGNEVAYYQDCSYSLLAFFFLVLYLFICSENYR